MQVKKIILDKKGIILTSLKYSVLIILMIIYLHAAIVGILKRQRLVRLMTQLEDF
jgi:hypothetical protein